MNPLTKALQTMRLSRLVFSVLILTALTAPTLKAAPPPDDINIVPTITGIAFTNGQLVATGIASITRNGQTTMAAFTVPLGLGVVSNLTNGAGCPVIDLALPPLELELLGIVIATSPICLDVSATPGGGPLGDLLCSVGGLLGGGLNLGQILNGIGLPGLPGLNPAQVNDLLAGLGELLNNVLDVLNDAVVIDLTNPGGGACGAATLAVGPVNLSLLGLNVSLDNCFTGPVTVDIMGGRGRGQLGNMLCAVLRSGRVDLGATLGDILSQLPGIR